MNAVAMNFIPPVQSYRLSSRLTILTDGFQAATSDVLSAHSGRRSASRKNHSRQGAPDPSRARLPARERASSDRRPARRRQDHARAGAREAPRTQFPSHPVHERHAPRRYHRRIGIRARKLDLQVPRGADFFAADPRRRGEPRHAPNPVGASRGDGGAPGHDRRRNAQAPRALFRRCDAEPFAPGGHLSAARVAARPVSDADRARISRPRRRAHPAPGRGPPRHDRRSRRLSRAGRPHGSAGDGEDRARRAAASRLHPDARRAFAALARVRDGPLAARGARAAARIARLGADRRPRQGRPGGRAGRAARSSRPPPAARARRGSHLEPRQGERPDLRRAHPVKLDRVLQYSQAYNFFQWVFGRHAPEPGVVFLSQRRVYILPTRHGLTFGLAVILMLIGSINYNLSLGYVLTFLLAGLGIVSILHTFRNLAHLYVSAGRVAPVFAGDTAQFELVFENKSDFDRHSLDLACRGARVSCDAHARAHRSVTLPVKAEKRGWLQLERVTVDTRFPLGLMRAWSYVQPDTRALVYPRPDLAPLPPEHSDSDTGDAISAGAASEPWFDWDQRPARMHTEARLSRLARWVMLAEERGLRYGLKLPGVEVPLGEGFPHLERCLKELEIGRA